LAPDFVDRRRDWCSAGRGRAEPGTAGNPRRDSRTEEVGAFDRLDPRRALQLGKMVRMTAGAFEDMVGRLVELRDQDRVVVLLELLGRAVPAQPSTDAADHPSC